MGTSTDRVARSPSRTIWRLARWPTDRRVGHLVLHDHLAVIDGHDVGVAVARARERGDRAVRTSALFPAAARVVLAAGFTPIDRLALLRRDLTEPLPAVDAPAELAPLRPWNRAAVARVDRAAFGETWGNSPRSLGEILRATPAHHARVARVDGQLVGTAISGGAHDAGYVQRVAVDPGARRCGIASQLVVDGLCWMVDRGATSALVNTGVDNHGALALYDSLGFELLDDQLVIAELALT